MCTNSEKTSFNITSPITKNILEVTLLAITDTSKRYLYCDISTIHITCNCSSRYLIWIWDWFSTHAGSIYWDQLALYGSRKSTGIEKVHGKLCWRLVDNYERFELMVFQGREWVEGLRGKDTWSSPCRTTRADCFAWAQVKLAHSVGALGTFVSQVRLERTRSSDLLVIEVCRN